MVDFNLLPLSALTRLAAYYSLPLDADKDSLVRAVAQQFSEQQVDEGEALSAFCLHSARTPLQSRAQARRRPASNGVSRTTGGSRVKGAQGSSSRKRSREVTYGDMISEALLQLPSRQGTLEEIYSVIEKRYAHHLNCELESGPRQIPVWKASVRKIINLNGMRFHRLSADRGGQPVFSLASSTARKPAGGRQVR